LPVLSLRMHSDSLAPEAGEFVGFHALSDLVACFRWCNEKRQETRETWVFKFGSRCVIDTAFFAKHKLMTCDTSITSYLGHAKALVATSMHREGLACACFPAPTLTAAGRPKPSVDQGRRRQYNQHRLHLRASLEQIAASQITILLPPCARPRSNV